MGLAIYLWRIRVALKEGKRTFRGSSLGLAALGKAPQIFLSLLAVVPWLGFWYTALVTRHLLGLKGFVPSILLPATFPWLTVTLVS